VASITELDRDDLAAVARAVPGVVAIITRALDDRHDVDLQVAIGGPGYAIHVTVHEHEHVVSDVTVMIDARSLHEHAQLVLLSLAARAMLDRQAQLERQCAARAAAILAANGNAKK
jgi:hypothetical protein